jgi:rhamnogalacturonyl hydrolase YesR
MRQHNVGLLSVFLLLGVFCCEGPAEDGPTESPAKTKQQPVPFSQVQLRGELNARYMAATCNLLTRTDRYALETFASNAAGRPGALWWDWPGDQVGRWLSVLHVAEGYGWTPAAENRKAVAEVVLPMQTKEGNFGPRGSAKSDDTRIPSGNGFALRGMMDAYCDSKDPRFLEAARRLARYFETIAPNWEKRENGTLHEFYGHCLDGLVALHEQTGDRPALDLAERLAKNAGRTAHTHHSLSLCRGLIDLARVTGKKEYLEKAEDYLAWCREKQTASGGLPEEMLGSKQDEGCGLADWIVVNLMMFQIAGEERYLDDAEHTLVNHFFMNQFHTGGFGHRSFFQEIVGGKGWQGWDGRFGSENPGCCSLWGQWALGQLGQFIVTQSDDTISVNLYPSAEIVLPERGVRLDVSCDFPKMTRVRIRVACEKRQSFTLALRIPPWARSMRVQHDGLEVQLPEKGRRVLLSGKWEGMTTVDVQFANEIRTVRWPVKKPEGVAVFDGPLCLGLSGSTANVDLPWAVPVDAAGRPVLDHGRPQVVDPSGHTTKPLQAINSRWLAPDVKAPARWRILFQIQNEKTRERR